MPQFFSLFLNFPRLMIHWRFLTKEACSHPCYKVDLHESGSIHIWIDLSIRLHYMLSKGGQTQLVPLDLPIIFKRVWIDSICNLKLRDKKLINCEE